MKLAKGKYIAIMNNDDVSYSYRIEKQYKFLEKTPRCWNRWWSNENY